MSACIPSRHALALAAALPLALCALVPAARAATPSAARFTLTGSAELAPATRVQSAGSLRLQASLQAETTHAAPSGGGYAIIASASPQSLVCTPDTIFMDGFDGN